MNIICDYVLGVERDPRSVVGGPVGGSYENTLRIQWDCSDDQRRIIGGSSDDPRITFGEYSEDHMSIL